MYFSGGGAETYGEHMCFHSFLLLKAPKYMKLGEIHMFWESLRILMESIAVTKNKLQAKHVRKLTLRIWLHMDGAEYKYHSFYASDSPGCYFLSFKLCSGLHNDDE